MSRFPAVRVAKPPNKFPRSLECDFVSEVAGAQLWKNCSVSRIVSSVLSPKIDAYRIMAHEISRPEILPES